MLDALKQQARKRNGVLITAKLLICLSLGISGFQHAPPDTSNAHKQLNEAIRLMDQEQFKQAVPLLEQAVAVFDGAGDIVNWVKTFKKLDYCYNSLNKPDEGIRFFENALHKNDLHDSIKLHLYLGLADNYSLKDKPFEAIANYEKGLPLAEKYHNKKAQMGYYAGLGWLYWISGNQAKALVLQKKSLELAIEEGDTDNIPTLYQYVGDCYRTLGDRQALQYFSKALQLAPDDVEIRIQYAKAYQAFQMPDSALIMLRSVLPLAHGDIEKADAYYLFACLLLDQHALAEAKRQIGTALTYGEKGYGIEHTEYARMSTMAGKIYLAAGQADDALNFFQQTLVRQCSGHIDADSLNNMTVSDLLPGSFWVLGSLEGKGQSHYLKYQQHQDIRYLQSALQTFELGISYAEKMRLSHSHELSKLELHHYVRPIIEGGVKTALQLAALSHDESYIEKAYLFAERDKAPVMAEALYDKEIKHIAGIPDSLLDKEKELQGKLTALESQVYASPRNDSLAKAKLDAQFELDKFKDLIQSQAPRYFDLKYAFQKPQSLSSIRQFIPENALLIQYMLGDSDLYIFAISNHSIQSYTRPWNDHLTDTLSTFHKSVSDWNYGKKLAPQAERDFLRTASDLYNLLLSKPLDGQQVHQLIIVPDGQLNGIPFEALLTAPYSGNWKSGSLPYLIKQYSVSYAWSAASLKPSEMAHNTLKYNFLGMGTEYDTSKATAPAPMALRDLGALPNADDEVKNINKTMGGKVWLNADATREHFLESAPESGILHIAAHGVLDEQNPMQSHLFFQPSDGRENRVYASELYNLDLAARMAVLSACNSGRGKVYGGEGMMSLARAFAYAGCPTLVSSLWNVNDLATSRLMTGFYKNLQEGNSVDEAMRSAKLAYLDDVNAEFSKPIYWAGFVVIGDPRPLPRHLFQPAIHPAWYWLTGIIVLIIAAFFLKKKRRMMRDER